MPASDNVEPRLCESRTEKREAPRVDDDEEAEDPGAAFVTWLIKGIKSDALALNTPKARVHVVDEGLLLVSPAVFQAFAGEQWREAQKRFLKRKLSEKTAAGENFFHYVLKTDRGKKTIKGVLIRDAEAKLGVKLPTTNSKLSRKSDGD